MRGGGRHNRAGSELCVRKSGVGVRPTGDVPTGTTHTIINDAPHQVHTFQQPDFEGSRDGRWDNRVDSAKHTSPEMPSTLQGIGPNPWWTRDHPPDQNRAGVPDQRTEHLPAAEGD